MLKHFLLPGYVIVAGILVAFALYILFSGRLDAHKIGIIDTECESCRFDWNDISRHDVSFGARKYNHAPSVASLGQGRLIAVWYAGEKEGGADMALRVNYFDGKQWSKARRLIGLSDIPYVTSRVGNPVVFVHPQEPKKIYIVFTTTLTGWATSYLNLIDSSDQGATWSVPKRLYLGPLFNFSHLVRCAPFFYENGHIGLPIYHEFINKFGMAIRFNSQGNVYDTYKLSQNRNAIQPCLNFDHTGSGVAFMRNTNTKNQGDRVVVNRFDQYFKGELSTIDVFNQDGSLSTINHNGAILMAYNEAPESKNMTLGLLDRAELKMNKLFVIDEEHSKYPYMIKDQAGLHVVYSANHAEKIKHVFIKRADNSAH